MALDRSSSLDLGLPTYVRICPEIWLLLSMQLVTYLIGLLGTDQGRGGVKLM